MFLNKHYCIFENFIVIFLYEDFKINIFIPLSPPKKEKSQHFIQFFLVLTSYSFYEKSQYLCQIKKKKKQSTNT